MLKGIYFSITVLVCMPLFAQGVTLSTETGYLNIDGSKIDLDYDNGEKEEIQNRRLISESMERWLIKGLSPGTFSAMTAN